MKEAAVNDKTDDPDENYRRYIGDKLLGNEKD